MVDATINGNKRTNPTLISYCLFCASHPLRQDAASSSSTHVAYCVEMKLPYYMCDSQRVCGAEKPLRA
eukprot:10180778-Alexandrium_andersonii.AAC.1